MVVEAPQERIKDVVDRLPSVKNLFVKQWIQLVALDPATGKLALQDSRDDTISFTPYTTESDSIHVAASSVAWYRGHRGNVRPARLLADAAGRRQEAAVP
jgi:hypothetical protein